MNEPLAWVEVEPEIEWWCGDWTIRWYERVGYYLTVSSGVQYGPYEDMEAVRQKAEQVRGD